jgi:hypothetical protein
MMLVPASLAAIGALVNYVLTLRIGVEVQKLRAEIAEARRQDAKEMRDWVDGRMEGGD